MRVVVFGATGTIGAPLVQALARDHDVVAVSRSERPDAGGVTWVQAEATDPESVRAALAGADVTYYLVHSLGSSDFEQRDRVAAETVAARARRRACGRSSTWAASGTTPPTSRPTCAAASRPAARSRPAPHR